MARLSLTARRNILLVITALVVCYVRHLLQYGRRPWAAGLDSFLGSWLAHYFAVAIVCALVLGISTKSDPFFFPGRPKRTTDEQVHETMVNVCITLLAAAVFAWFVSLWPGSGDPYD
jgi:hypothetical protein